MQNRSGALPKSTTTVTRIVSTHTVSTRSRSSTVPTSSIRQSTVAAAVKMLRSRIYWPSQLAGLRSTLLLGLLVALGMCGNLAASSPTQQQQPQQQHTVRIQQCREGCFEKFATKEILCQQNPECLTCWQECAKPPPPKINKSIRETWTLHTVSMLQQDSLVLVDVAWTPLSTPNQCLVTWEVSGGGLMGNLLTESFNVQLSLWPDTKYRVQVTCKNKLTGAMSRSLPLTIDTTEAVALEQQQLHRQSLFPATTTLFPGKFPLADAGNANGHEDTGIAAVAPVNSIEQDIAAVLPYEADDEEDDDNGNGNGADVGQSAETIHNDQHTNFIFNWHSKNSDISVIEPIHKPELNLLTIATLSDMQKPLLFGVVAGTLLLMLILLVYVCMLRQQRLPGDKAALIEDDDDDEVHSVVVSIPGAAASSSASTAGALPTSVLPSSRGGSRSRQQQQQLQQIIEEGRLGEEVYGAEGPVVCKNPAICSRNTLKV